MFIREVNEIKTITLNPNPILVIKSLIISPATFANVKIFINLCHDHNVPEPPTPFNPIKTFSEIMNNSWEIPIITSPRRDDTDKKLNYCVVYDCIVNSYIIEDINNSSELKNILIEWCIESVELRDNLVISRDVIKFPKLKFKGNSPPPILEIRNDVDEDESLNKEDSNSFSKWKQDLLDRQEIEGEQNELKTLFPEDSHANKMNQNTKVLIEDISDQMSNTSINSNPTINNSGYINRAKLDFKYDVIMRKTTNTERYKLRIQINIIFDDSTRNTTLLSHEMGKVQFKSFYDANSNELKVINIESSSNFKEKSIVIPLPNFVKELRYNEDDFKIFNVKKNQQLIIFI